MGTMIIFALVFALLVGFLCGWGAHSQVTLRKLWNDALFRAIRRGVSPAYWQAYSELQNDPRFLLIAEEQALSGASEMDVPTTEKEAWILVGQLVRSKAFFKNIANVKEDERHGRRSESPDPG